METIKTRYKLGDNMHSKYIIVLFFIIPFCVLAETADSEWIERMKSLNAHKLHSSLPEISYEKWFYSFIGEKTKPQWEVNDCGEQNGRGVQKDFPICVEVSAKLLGNKKLVISTILGTYKKGIIGTPKIWMMYIEENGKYKVLKDINEVVSHLSNEKNSIK